MTDIVTTLGDAEIGSHVVVELSDGTRFEGRASPIDYVPEESLRVEVRPEDDPTARYELSAEYGEEWDDVRVRHADVDAEDPEWEQLGVVERVEVTDEEQSGDGWPERS